MKNFFLLLLTLILAPSLFAQNPTIKRLPKIAAPSSTCGFLAVNSSDIPMAVLFGKENTIVFDKESFDDANAFNGMVFKAPSAGVYQFTAQIGLKAKNTGADISQVLMKIKTASQSSSQIINIPGNYDNVITGNVTALFKLQANEEVSVVLINTGNATASTTGNLSNFSGVKLY